MTDTEVNGVRLYYELTGTGDAVVFVHGSLLDHHDWDVMAAQIAQSFQVLSYDRRGHSRSSGNGTFDDDVADLAALIEYLQLAPVHLVGNSLGGCIAVRLAVTRPELLRSVSIHEPPLLALLADDPKTWPVVEQVQHRVQAVLDDLATGKTDLGARRFVEEIALGDGAWEDSPHGCEKQSLATRPPSSRKTPDPGIYGIDLHALSHVEIPVLIAQGTESPPFFASVLDQVQAVLPQIERRVLHGQGHLLSSLSQTATRPNSKPSSRQSVGLLKIDPIKGGLRPHHQSWRRGHSPADPGLKIPAIVHEARTVEGSTTCRKPTVLRMKRSQDFLDTNLPADGP
jgi:pimeloyl-ACP methyl ester carboxylesterase